MDDQQFDRMTQQLGRALNRRRFGVLAAALGFGAGAGIAPDVLTKKKRPKKKKKRKAKGGTGTPTSTTTPAPQPTCTDGVKNGNETDVDCGGRDCPLCENGKSCSLFFGGVDCRSGRCTGVCQACASDDDCLSDHNGECFCHTASGRCASQAPIRSAANCGACPEGWVCSPATGGVICRPTCSSSGSCGVKDHCIETFGAHCGHGGLCFQPLGGGPTQCATSISGSCGCGSDQECVTQHGAGAFCATFSPRSACSCGTETTFCARPRPL